MAFATASADCLKSDDDFSYSPCSFCRSPVASASAASMALSNGFGEDGGEERERRVVREGAGESEPRVVGREPAPVDALLAGDEPSGVAADGPVASPRGVIGRTPAEHSSA